ncbi:MAG: hypothetical protein ACYDEY_11495, partial [Acidimicrobiales bacterium]
VHAASFFHDGSVKCEKKIGYGNNWVIFAIVVRLAFLDRPIALPVGFALVRKELRRLLQVGSRPQAGRGAGCSVTRATHRGRS